MIKTLHSAQMTTERGVTVLLTVLADYRAVLTVGYCAGVTFVHLTEAEMDQVFNLFIGRPFSGGK